eukprot:Gregarina_sp_Poly_1__565@NODE_1135_length_4981_cov_83_856532_g784_i0_p2_GENE_NODE_1135_length_4981_cov_83_856532_g784_i0NODE_1135_length_4981_cov_83_856532_g784_i0_p2_ORF_typecomplete_len459_score66_67XRCC4/PF06632_12/2_3e02XRCC4/PF06632_12/8_7e05Vps4_C/PF09336_10/41Vps4_C/PF09336_10/1_3AsmA_1/PF13109_6/0_21AsmA_1/PF13109_6/1e03_NODE_1135_length_4981_cov_83_856532_g784_i018083184
MPQNRLLFDAPALSLDYLFDSAFATQQDYLYELNAVESEGEKGSEPGVRASDITRALSRLDQQTVSVVDLLPRNPLLSVKDVQHTAPGSKKRRLLSFPVAMGGAGTHSRSLEETPVSRIAVLSHWDLSFNAVMKQLKLTQLKLAEDNDTNHDHKRKDFDDRMKNSKPSLSEITENGSKVFVNLDVFDGEDIWKGSIKFKDLRILDCDVLSHLFRFLVYGKSLDETNRKTQLLVRGYFERLSTNDARLHLFHNDALLQTEGIELELSQESKPDFISKLFVASYKRQMLTQSLLANLLYSLRSIQDSTLEVLNESRRLSDSAKVSRQAFLQKVLNVLNSKKEKIASLHKLLGDTTNTNIERSEDKDTETNKEIKIANARPKRGIRTTAAEVAEPKAKARSKAKARAKPRSSQQQSCPTPETVYSAVSEHESHEEQTHRTQPSEDSSLEVDLFSGWAADSE